MRRSSSLKVSSYGIVNASNERKEGRDKKNEGRRKEEDRKAGTKDSTIYFCIKKEWFSLEYRKVNGSICITWPQDWLTKTLVQLFPAQYPESPTQPIKHLKGENHILAMEVSVIIIIMVFID